MEKDKLKKELFEKRDNLAESLRINESKIKELREKFEISINPLKKHFLDLRRELEDVRSKLYDLGISEEDC